MSEAHSHMHSGASFQVFPGITATYGNFEVEQASFHHDDNPHLMEINHCHYGRVGWDLNNGSSIYVGEGDVTLHSAALCSNSTMHFPLGSYQGLTITMDLDALRQELPEPLRDAQLNIPNIAAAFCRVDNSVQYHGDANVEQIFAPLYHLPQEMVLPYLRVKTMELLLFLNLQSRETPKTIFYKSDTTEAIRQMHQLITSDLSHRHTIDELSRQFLINTSTLKEVFKAVYGMPIAAYMKEYRIRHAAKLLRHTEDSVADISTAVGYETQSKFTKAFKEILGTTPRDYRRQLP